MCGSGGRSNVERVAAVEQNAAQAVACGQCDARVGVAANVSLRKPSSQSL